MNNEQSLLLAIRHHMSVLGYTESDIDSKEVMTQRFATDLIMSLTTPVPIKSSHNTAYEYYMHINDPNFNGGGCSYDALMCTFESESDWEEAVYARDTETCNAIIAQVTEFCKTHRVPSAVVDFYKKMPKYVATRNWAELEEYIGIVDAYCDEDADEYVDGVTGL